MTIAQSIWGNGYHTGVRDTLFTIGVIALIAWIFWLLSKREKQQEQVADTQPTTSGIFTLQQPTYQY